MLPTNFRHRGLGSDPGQRADPVPDAGQGAGSRRGWVVHPFLIAVFPILALYAHNVHETLPRSLAAPIGVALAATLAIWLPLRWLTRDGRRAGLATSFLVAAFYGFNYLARYLNGLLYQLSAFWVRRQTDVHPLVIVALLTPVTVAVFYAIFRRVKDAGAWTTYLNTFALVLAALPAGNAALARLYEPARPIIRSSGGIPTAARPARRPDIYHIVLDAYARSDVMSDLFGFDNEPFLRRLEQKGFFVARRSTANYCQTTLSLSSMLNCDYLDTLVDMSSHNLEPLSGLIRDNLVVKSLRPHGYKFVAFAPGYDQTECPDADVCLGPRPPGDAFHLLLIRMTPLRFLPFKQAEWDYYISVRERVLFTLDHLPDVALRAEPTFTFAHIVSPHHPFVFGEDGEDISPRRGRTAAKLGPDYYGTPEEYRENYRRQAIFVTRRVEETIDRILANSPEPPIIILQSDHGSGLRHHMNDVEATDLRERMSILNGYYFPGREYQQLRDDITPVNSFRVVLNAYFGAGLPLREDINYFSTYNDAFDVIDVTERLRSGRDAGRTYTPPSFYPGMVH